MRSSSGGCGVGVGPKGSVELGKELGAAEVEADAEELSKFNSSRRTVAKLFSVALCKLQ